MKILITGTAGFIGAHLAKRLVDEGFEVVGLDNINDYYDINLKYDRLSDAGINREEIEYGLLVQSGRMRGYRFIKLNLEDRDGIEKLFAEEGFDYVFNLAAQAGVRYSIDHPHSYIESNIVGFINILEGCRHNRVKHLFYASSSSVYALCPDTPFKEDAQVDNPISLYAATKKSNELMAHVYSYLYGLPTTGLRFFTVYGPWGRPDMAPLIFINALLDNRPIEVFNHGDMARDFTFIDDIIEGVYRLLMLSLDSKGDDKSLPYEIFNIGNSKPVKLIDFIDAVERATGVTAKKKLLPMQPGDVYITYADTTKLYKKCGYKPSKDIYEGVKETAEWCRAYYNK